MSKETPKHRRHLEVDEIKLLVKLEEKIVRFGSFGIDDENEVKILERWHSVGFIDIVKKERRICYLVMSDEAIAEAHFLRLKFAQAVTRQSIEECFAEKSRRLEKIIHLGDAK